MRNQICLDLCTIKTFHSLKRPPHYKQSIYLIKLQKRLVLDPRDKVTSSGHKHLHKHRLQSKTSTNSLLLTIGSAHWRSVANSWLLIKLNVSVASKANRYYNPCRSCLHWIQYTDVRLLSDSVQRSSLLSGQMQRKNHRFDVFGLNSSFTSLYRYQTDPSVRNKWIFYF